MPTTEQRIAELRSRLSDEQFTGLSAVVHVTTFRARRGDDPVTVEIEDRGHSCHPYRYRCIARTEDGRVATGNPAETPETAILTTHWNKLRR